ncbi:hypothetical protein OIU78_015851, partial [Salix suchowensis]
MEVGKVGFTVRREDRVEARSFHILIGGLRPYPISPYRVVPPHIDRPDWAVDGIPKIEPSSDLQHVVEIKTPEKIERMR